MTDDDDVARASGPSGRVLLAEVVETVLSAAECSVIVASRASGAVVTFEGVVRDHDEGRDVVALHYEQHPSAGDVMGSVAEQIAAEHPAVTIAVQHRVGDLEIGDVALACAVASPHRAEAFAACSALVDLVKQRLPIWKRQAFTDGPDEWTASLG
ncbi:molybdenum cofactor biosynthesis protein MoaE [Frigoribacterium sp. ACAM 257]|uniref:molybdenum cofactor biosynthesis protein MoaE n=1 Tax=Frigoribacterium sp. ACAM 257 TaxID=2508998 RepID=UPI0011B9C3EF|nr:molybdenum cofactor biosynthesis protein MoaE [Frigoribacterium sp. ACAM 257]TWX37096.1 molybdenum cofactor biosynthesis protein MoaE [Frigoribacterium sp. ACAM 257]